MHQVLKFNINKYFSENDCKKASRQIARLVQRSMNKLHIKLCMRNYKICNMMATCKMPFGIKIEEIPRKYPKASYEPEVHAGLNWQFDDPKATLIIHTTGSITITGATSEAGIISIIESIYPILQNYSCAQRGLGGYNPVVQRKRIQDNMSQQFYVAKRPRTLYSYRMDNAGCMGPSSSGIIFSDEEDLDEEMWQDANFTYEDETEFRL